MGSSQAWDRSGLSGRVLVGTRTQGPGRVRLASTGPQQVQVCNHCARDARLQRSCAGLVRTPPEGRHRQAACVPVVEKGLRAVPRAEGFVRLRDR